SIRNNINDLIDIIEGNNDHVVMLTETWMYPEEVNAYEISGFSSVHNTRAARGGGASIYVRYNIDIISTEIKPLD
ncbi:hypothetical protein HHI36_002447, partial [Cryptolaemus montrouzieri]